MRKTTNVWNLRAPVSCAMTMCLCIFALSSCKGESGSGPMLIDEIVTIEFDGDGCPTAVDKPDFLANKETTRVVWKSGSAADKGYEIFFDPFNGQPHKSNRQGEVKVSIARNTPNKNKPGKPEGIEYKYTIVGNRCIDEPHDPRFRVR